MQITVSPVAPATTGNDNAQLANVQSDLAGIDDASGQADSDLGAATAAQAQNDTP